MICIIIIITIIIDQYNNNNNYYYYFFFFPPSWFNIVIWLWSFIIIEFDYFGTNTYIHI